MKLTDVAETYEDYIINADTLTLEQMQEIHKKLCAGLFILKDNEICEELFQDVLVSAKSYMAEYRAPWWSEWDKENRRNRDMSRTEAHDHLIRSFNILARYMENQKISIEWRNMLGDEEEHRKRIGDFGCYLVFINCLNAR